MPDLNMLEAASLRRKTSARAATMVTDPSVRKAA
jgi:hypothetical protein